MGSFEWGKGCSIVKYRDSAMSCGKTAERIKMPFDMWTRVGSGIRVRWGAYWHSLVNTVKPSMFTAAMRPYL